jgi:hypothetical protein
MHRYYKDSLFYEKRKEEFIPPANQTPHPNWVPG